MGNPFKGWGYSRYSNDFCYTNTYYDVDIFRYYYPNEGILTIFCHSDVFPSTFTRQSNRNNCETSNNTLEKMKNMDTQISRTLNRNGLFPKESKFFRSLTRRIMRISLRTKGNNSQRFPKSQENPKVKSPCNDIISRKQARRLKDELHMFQIMSFNSEVVDCLPCEATDVSSLSDEEIPFNSLSNNYIVIVCLMMIALGSHTCHA